MSSNFCIKILLFFKKLRKSNMDVKGWSLEELAKEIGISEGTVQTRIHRANIEPLFRGSIYPPDTLDKIREAPMGRPKKQPEK
jgi:transcriptional regulator with XRE-family HTH domain